MGAPTVYYYDDPGAPVLSSGQDAFYQIILACLVDGYGSKPAAGWSVVYDDWASGGVASFTNQQQSGVLGVVRSPQAGNAPFLFISEAMLDARTPINARSGIGIISDIGEFSEGSKQQQRPWIRSLAIGAWCVVANENCAWIFVASSDSDLHRYGASSSRTSNSFMGVCGIGALRDVRGLGGVSDAELGNFHIVGGNWGTNSGYGGWNSSNSYPQTSAVFNTVLYGIDNVLLSAPAYAMNDPFSMLPSVSPFRVPDRIVEFQLVPLSVYVSENLSSSFKEYGWQRAVIPMLKTNLSLVYPSSVSVPNSESLGVACLRDLIDIDGRSHLVCQIPDSAVALISLGVEDWM